MVSVQTISNTYLYKTGDSNEISLNLLISLLSSYLLKQHFDKVILFADKESAKLYKDTFYTEIRVIDNSPFTKVGYESFSKLFAYSQMEEEFVHVDLDYFMFKNDIVLNNNIVCAWIDTPEKTNIAAYNSTYNDNVDIFYNNNLFIDFKIVDKNISLNKSVYGVSKELIYDVSIHYKKFLNEVIQNIDKIKELSNNAQSVIEQHLPIQFFLEKGYKIDCLKDTDVDIIYPYGKKWQINDLNKTNGPIINNWNNSYLEIIKSYIKSHNSYHMLFGKTANNILYSMEIIIKNLYPEVWDVYNRINYKQKNLI